MRPFWNWRELFRVVMVALGLGVAAQAINYHYGEPVHRYALAVAVGVLVGAVMGGRTP